jgi:gamma-glutamyltranspeptidase / glutathione hydrolase
MRSRRRTSVAALLAALFATLAGPAGAPALVKVAQPAPFALSLHALLGASQTDLYLNVSSATAQLPESLTLVQVKVFAQDGSHLRTETFHEVASPGGVAAVPLAGLERNQVVEVKAHAKDGSQNNLEAQTKVLLRPDLTVRGITAPARVVRRQSFTLQAEIAELAGDTGARASVSLYDGGAVVATAQVAVAAGGDASVSFSLQFAGAGGHSFTLVVAGAAPAEANAANNDGSSAVKVALYDADGAVASDEPDATRVGEQILENGGNAIDAAVAMQFVLGVTQPQNVGIGGGATILVHLAGRGDFTIDARELSPAVTDPNQYHPQGNLNFKVNANSSGFIVGVPGSLKAAEVLLQRWGTMSLSDSLQPAIGLAQNGFEVGRALADATDPGRRCQNVGQPETKALFCHSDGLEQGSTFVQPELAKTYRLIAERGTDVFYGGAIADAIVEATHRTRVPDRSGVGTMTVDDIKAYTLDESAPISVMHAGHQLLSVGGSSAGGYIALQVLRMLELRRADFPIGGNAQFGWMAPDTAHVMTEAAALAFADHFYWMGGGDVPRDGLLSDCYLDQRAQTITLDKRIVRPTPRPVGNPRACNAATVFADAAAPDESRDGMTSHFSVLDKWGNAVSFTTTLTDAFGSGILVLGYGIVLNDALSNFNSAPAAKPGAFPTPGDPGTNDPGPTKRARGYTAPLIALKDGEPVLITGSPGGFAIPSVVLQVVLNMFDFGLPVQEAVDRARLWWNLTTVLWNESPVGPQIPQDTLSHLRSLGNIMAGPNGAPQVGGAQSIAVDPSTFAVSVAKDRLIPDATTALVQPR